MLDKLLGTPMKQADMGIGAVDDLAVELKHQTQHPVGRRMLGSEIHGIVVYPVFRHDLKAPLLRFLHQLLFFHRWGKAAECLPRG